MEAMHSSHFRKQRTLLPGTYASLLCSASAMSVLPHCYLVTVSVLIAPVITGRADPDFTKKLKWQPLQELTFKDLATQVCGGMMWQEGSERMG